MLCKNSINDCAVVRLLRFQQGCVTCTVMQYFLIGFYSSGYHLCLHLYKNVREDLLLAQKCARGFAKLPNYTEVSSVRGRTPNKILCFEFRCRLKKYGVRSDDT